MDLGILKTEINIDPLTRGYSGMSDLQTADDLNTVYRTRNKEIMTATEVFNAISKSEFNILSATNKKLIWDILHLDEINPFGLEADLFIDIFGGGSATITTLQSLRKDNISRGVELGIGNIREGNIWEARL